MSKKTIFEKWDGNGFALVFFILAGLSFNSFTANRSFLLGIVAIVLVWALYRFIATVPLYVRGRKVPCIWPAMIFIASYLASTIVNYQYNLVENIQALAWISLYILILYPSGCFETLAGHDFKRPVRYIFCDLVIAWTFVMSLACIITKICDIDVVLSNNAIVGFHGSRLYGVYTDPNYGGILSACGASMAAMYLMKKDLKIWQRILLIVQIALQYLFILFGYSRTGRLMFSIAVILTFLYWLFARKEKFVKRLAIGIVACFLAFGYSIPENTYNYIIEINKPETPVDPDAPSPELKRDQNATDDFFEIRLPIWMDGFHEFKLNPVFGISYRGISPWFETNMPDAYIVNHEPPINTFHNSIVDVIVSQGAVGTAIVVLMLVLFIVKSIKFWPKLTRGEKDDAVLFGIPVLVIMGGALMISDIFYINSPNSITFWYALGQWMKYDTITAGRTKKSEEIDEK